MKIENRCYKNENCHRNNSQEENFIEQRFHNSLPVANNLAVQKGSVLLTRKFALVPDVYNLDDQNKIYSTMTDMFVKITSLKNLYIKKLIEHAKAGHLDDFKGSSMINARRVYDSLNFTKFDGLPFSKEGNKQFNLKERVKQCANFEAYIIVRNWLIRNENLTKIIDFLISKFENDNRFALTFLAGKRFSSNEIKDIRNMLGKNCFGQRQPLSTYYLNNHIYQIRNVSNGFTKRKKKKVISVHQRDLLQYLLGLYFRKCKSLTTRLAQRILALRNRKSNLTTQKSIKRIESSIRFTEKKLSYFITPFYFATKKQFIHERDMQIDCIKAQVLQEINAYTLKDLYQLIEVIFNDEIETYFHSDNQYVMKSIFKPKFPSIRILDISFDSLMEYIETKLRYKIRENVKEFFINENVKTLFIKGFEYIKENFYDGISRPQVSRFSLNLIMFETFRDEYDNLKFKLGFIKNKFIPFKITDKRNRLKQFMAKFTPANPTITFKHRKLLLNLPFEKKKGNSKPFQENKFNNSSNLEMGVDLNLAEHPAVLSIRDMELNREVARYFINWNALMNGKLVQEFTTNADGKFVLKRHLTWQYHSRQEKITNIKLRLINLRSQIRILQRKKNNYEQRLLDNGISNFRSKLKWNKIRYELSLCWNKLHNINSHIVGLLNHFIIQIAKFHRITTIKVEDLRFSKHSKKSDSGKFIAFWQVQWFFSQVQDAIKLQCKLEGNKFQKVPARKTSQRCSRCGKLGTRNRKHFYCAECGLNLDSDLNASRNIVQYVKYVNHRVDYQVYFNDPIW